jgi:GNAT superfamily N-acetyltransferase
MVRIEPATRSLLSQIASFYLTCGYDGGVSEADTVLAAYDGTELAGAVRLCPGSGVIVLRGMQVLPRFQRRGIGSSLLASCVPHFGPHAVFCLPWAHLEAFYAPVGFARINPKAAPDFLSQRYSSYIARDLKVIVMERPLPDRVVNAEASHAAREFTGSARRRDESMASIAVVHRLNGEPE